MESTPQRVPVLRGASAAIVALESLALLVAGGIYVLRAVGGAAPADAALALGAMALVTAAALGVAAVSLARGRSWPRGLAITWQLLQITAGVVLLEISTLWGVAAIAAAAVGAAVLVADARARPAY